MVLTEIEPMSHVPTDTLCILHNLSTLNTSTDRLRRMAQAARFAQNPTKVNNVALPDKCNFDEDAVTVGAIFLALVTFIWCSQRRCSVGTFTFS